MVAGRLARDYSKTIEPKVIDPWIAVGEIAGRDITGRSSVNVRCFVHDESNGTSLGFNVKPDGTVKFFCLGRCKDDRTFYGKFKDMAASLYGIDPETWSRKTNVGEPAKTVPLRAEWWESLPLANGELKSIVKKKPGVGMQSLLELGARKNGGELLYPIWFGDELVSYRRWNGSRFINREGTGTGNHLVIPVALDRDRPVWVCESETSALAMRTAGHQVAWIPSAGAKPPEAELLQLRGYDCRVGFDHDDAGRKGAQRLSDALRAVGARVRVVQWPDDTEDRWDLRDELNAGYDPEELVVDVNPLGGKEYDLTDLEAIPPNDPLVEGVLDLRTYNVVAGAGGANKTFFALDLACCVATGQAWKGREIATGPVPVTFVVGEGQSGLRKRVAAWEAENRVRVPRGMIRFIVRPHSLLGAEAWNGLRDRVLAHGSRLVIFDTLSSLWPDIDETKDAAVVTRRLGDLALEADAATLLLHHTGWGEMAQKRVRGGSQWENNADAVFIMSKVEETDLCELWLKKVKDGESGEKIYLRRELCLESCVLREAAPPKREAQPKDKKSASVVNVLHELSTRGPMGSYELREACNGRHADVSRMIGVAVDKGFVLVETAGRGKKVHTITDEGIEELEGAKDGLNREY
jgi:hypothetical protein